MHYHYGFDDLLWDAIRMDNPEQFVSIYTFKGFHKVDDTNGSVLVGSATYVRVSFKMLRLTRSIHCYVINANLLK